MREELYGDSKLEDLLEFCYLGEMLLLDAAVCWLYSHMLLVCRGQVWPTTASSHQPLFASDEPRLGVLNKWKEPDEA